MSKKVFLAAALSAAFTASPSYADIQLEEEIVVTASRVAQPKIELSSSVEVISAEEIKLRGYKSLSDLLITQTSITAVSSGGVGKVTNLRIRGETGYRTRFIIDGIDMSDASATQVGPRVEQLLSTGDIERIEILRGAQGFAYGADSGGIINIFTKSGASGLAGGISYEQGSNNTKRSSINVAAGDELFDIYLSADQLNSDGFNAVSIDVQNADDDGFQNTTRYAKFGINPAKDVRLEFAFRDIDSETEYDGLFGTALFGNQNSSTYNQTMSRSSLAFKTGPVSHKIAKQRSEVDRVDESPTFKAPNSSETDRLEYTANADVTQSLDIGFGLDKYRERVESKNISRKQKGGYLEARVNAFEGLYFNAGARYDDHDDFGVHKSYRVGSAYILGAKDNKVKFKASYGTGFRAPSPGELAFNAARPSAPVLTEETSKGYDLGVEWSNTSGYELDLTYFRQNIQDEIVYLGFGPGYSQLLGNNESQGAELSWSLPLLSALVIEGNYTYNHTETADGQARRRVPRHSGNVAFRSDLFDKKLSIMTNARFSRNSYDGLGAKRIELDNYVIVDLSMVYRVTDNFDLNVRVTNLLDKKYRELPLYNSDDRSAYFGFSAKIP